MTAAPIDTNHPSHPALRVLVFSASLRAGSFNTRLAQLAARAVESYGASVDLASMRDFDAPSYDGDAETAGGAPPGAHELKRRLELCDAFIIAAPEYNGSMPGLLKNAIDWASRFRPQPFYTRQCLLMSASPSLAGGNRGLWALRMPLEHLGARVFPEMFSLATAHKAFGDDGAIADPALAARFEANVRAFLELAEAAKHYACIKRAWVEFVNDPHNIAERPEPVAVPERFS